jgi:peptide-methionine (S)-S-oxide reductase
MTEFRVIYPSDEKFADSTAAARINGYLGGNSTYKSLLIDIEQFGLSSAGRSKLKEIVRKLSR